MKAATGRALPNAMEVIFIFWADRVSTELPYSTTVMLIGLKKLARVFTPRRAP